jgi:hypothetical protein
MYALSWPIMANYLVCKSFAASHLTQIGLAVVVRCAIIINSYPQGNPLISLVEKICKKQYSDIYLSSTFALVSRAHAHRPEQCKKSIPRCYLYNFHLHQHIPGMRLCEMKHDHLTLLQSFHGLFTERVPCISAHTLALYRPRAVGARVGSIRRFPLFAARCLCRRRS